MSPNAEVQSDRDHAALKVRQRAGRLLATLHLLLSAWRSQAHHLSHMILPVLIRSRFSEVHCYPARDGENRDCFLQTRDASRSRRPPLDDGRGHRWYRLDSLGVDHPMCSACFDPGFPHDDCLEAEGVHIAQASASLPGDAV